ncbi:MAG: glycosyltransferase [Firmicutes bacterium]|nr:glycosyltransferase [Bacillota bacterium]
MNILINCSNLKLGGALQVSHSFLYELRNYPLHKYIVVLSPQMEEIVYCNDFSDNFVFIPHLVKFSWNGNNSFLDSVVEKYKIEKVFTVFGPAYWRPKVFHICGYARPQYIYKESPFFQTLTFKQKVILKIKKIIHIHSFKQADVLITENEDVTKRLKKIIPNKEIFTITNYYNQVFDNENLWDKSIELPKFDGVTLLTISANYPHKNLQIIPNVIAYLNQTKPNFKFRFAISLTDGQLNQNLDKDIKKHILFLGKVPINQCPYLYEQSDFMFLPTLLECFSASYAEAMRMQKPILTSDLGFARGLCGDAALYFNSLSEKDISNKIIELSENKELQNILISEGKKQLLKFDNYKERTEKYLEIIEK